MKTTLTVFENEKKSHINREIYGHFSEHLGRCIYGGLFVGEDSDIPNIKGMRKDVVDALKALELPVLRWPGGCFADEYHWKDGIGPKESRKRMINTNWGGVVEDNSFGTHEFLELCEILGCEPYIAGNLGSGTVQELSEWVEYMTFDGESPMANLRKENGHAAPWKIKYLGIGNENWGCGGNMEPEYYASEYRRYQSFCKDFSGNQLYKIACGPNGNDKDWTRRLLSHVNKMHTKGISLHYYTVPTGVWEKKGSATVFSEELYYDTLSKTQYMAQIIKDQKAIMDEFDPNVDIALIVDEWGCWYDVEEGTNPGFLYQQNTMRDAMVAAINFDIFNQNSDRVKMANIAQIANVLQSVVLTEGDLMVKTPTYYAFDLYKGHQDADLLESFLPTTYIDGTDGVRQLTHTVSVQKDQSKLLTITNVSLCDTATITVQGLSGEVVSAQILTGKMDAHNTFDAPETVGVSAFDGVVKNADGTFTITLPPVSIVSIKVK